MILVGGGGGGYSQLDVAGHLHKSSRKADPCLLPMVAVVADVLQ